MSSPRKSFSLKLLGGCVLEDATGPLTGRAVQRRRLACLALVGAAGRAGVTRDQLERGQDGPPFSAAVTDAAPAPRSRR